MLSVVFYAVRPAGLLTGGLPGEIPTLTSPPPPFAIKASHP